MYEWSTAVDSFINIGRDNEVWVRVSQVAAVWPQDGHTVVQMISGEKLRSNRSVRQIMDVITKKAA